MTLRSSLTLGCTALIVSLASVSASAHHSKSNFDGSKTVSVTGTLVEFAWSNPHIFFEVSDGNDIWLFETGSLTNMKRRGWTKDSFKIGDTYTFSGRPDRNAEKNFVDLQSIALENGEQVQMRGGQRNQAADAPSLDFSGTWRMDLSSFDIRGAGGPPPADWPYSEEGQRQADAYDPEDSPELECKHIGVPRILIYPYSINFTRKADRLDMYKDHLHEERTIWFSEADAKAADEAPSPTGTSVAKIHEGNTLHIFTNNFAPTEWGIENALDSTDQKTVEEVYTLADDGLSIDGTIIISDPVLFTEPIERPIRFIKETNREFEKVPCDKRAANRHVTLVKTDKSAPKDPPKATTAKRWWKFWE